MIRSDRGFTLIEVVIVLTVSSFFVGLIMYFGISYWRYSALLENDLDTFVSRLNVQDIVREAIGTSAGLITQNSLPDNHANNPDPISGSNYWLAMHAVPGNVPVGTSGTTTPLLYFRRYSINTSGAVVMNGTQPYEDEYVMYMDGSTRQLLLRSLANPNATNNKLLTSCPSSVATSSCPADRVLMDQLSSVDVTYYSRSGNSINYQSITDPVTGTYIGPDFSAVEALQYTFHVAKKTLFQQTTSTINDTVIRIALRNT